MKILNQLVCGTTMSIFQKKQTCFLLLFFVLVTEQRRSFSDHYLRNCGNVTCSRPQQMATWLRLEPGTWPGPLNPKFLGFVTAPVRSTHRIHTFSHKASQNVCYSIHAIQSTYSPYTFFGNCLFHITNIFAYYSEC